MNDDNKDVAVDLLVQSGQALYAKLQRLPEDHQIAVMDLWMQYNRRLVATAIAGGPLMAREAICTAIVARTAPDQSPYPLSAGDTITLATNSPDRAYIANTLYSQLPVADRISGNGL